MRFRKNIELERPGLQLAPMIDVVFLLLIFFLVTWAYARFETELDVRVPVAKEGADPDRSVGEIIVNVRRDGALMVEARELSQQELLGMMSRTAAIHKDVAVILRGDRETAYEKIVGVLDLCREAGIWNVAFATDRPENPQP
jgi:biopolymer transport protein ExbD